MLSWQPCVTLWYERTVACISIQLGIGDALWEGLLKILIAENDPSVRALMGMELRTMGHTEISWATNGREALISLKKTSTDLVISAWSMPEMDGLSLLRACKKDPALRRIPFVMMSTRPDHWRQAVGAGADAYLVKPFSSNELKEVLRKIGPSGYRRGAKKSIGMF